MVTITHQSKILLLLGGLIFVAACFVFYSKRTTSRHKRYISASHKRLDTLYIIGQEKGLPSQLNYLRKLNAYVFEEMILTAIERKSHKVKRNKRYSGDGGIDGEFMLNGQPVLIQAKRYKDGIVTQHVREFKSLCLARGAKGIFVHTGKTPAAAFQLASDGMIEIISGQKLMELLLPS